MLMIIAHTITRIATYPVRIYKAQKSYRQQIEKQIGYTTTFNTVKPDDPAKDINEWHQYIHSLIGKN